MTRKFGYHVLAAAMLAGTFSIPTFNPAEAAQRDECHRIATNHANRVAPSPAAGAVGGAIIGGIAGALIGSANNSRAAGRGALIGGGVGAVAGAGTHKARWNAAYDRKFGDCMSSAYYQQPAYNSSSSGAELEPWSPEWYAYCESKYRSFNRDTGTYTTYSGQNKFCQ